MAERGILIYGRREASSSLYFDGLPPDMAALLRFCEPGGLAHDLPHLLAASAVVVLREFRPLLTSGGLEILVGLGIAVAWFVDDDLLALAEEEAAFAFYTPERAADFAAQCSAIIVSTPALARRMRPLHGNIILWPPVFDANLARAAASPEQDCLTVGCVGGGFRGRSLREDILPALAEMRRHRPVRLYATQALLGRDSGPDEFAVPFEADFPSFVHVWQRLGVHVLLHPYGETRNIANKSAATLLAAAYLGAVPVVGLEPAFAGLSEGEGVLQAAPGSAHWLACLERAGDPAERRRLLDRLNAYCKQKFSPEHVRAAFLELRALEQDASVRRRGLRICWSRRLSYIVMVSYARRCARFDRMWRLIADWKAAHWPLLRS